MNRSKSIPPARVQDLEQWQQRSESKFPPSAPRQRLHELPHLAAANAAAGAPTIDEEMPVSPPAPHRPADGGDVVHGDEVPRDPDDGFYEDPAIERAKDGTTHGEDSGAETNPSAVG